MRVLVVFGSKRGGTAGLAKMLTDALRAEGLDVEIADARNAPSPEGFDAVIVGGALYANRWYATAKRWVDRNERALARVATWFFSSGPLDDSARGGSIEPVWMVQTRMERVGARGHMTFGGKLDASDPSPVAKGRHGDFRDPSQVREWAGSIARALPAKPGPIVHQPARSARRLVAHGLVGWAVCSAIIGALFVLVPRGAALAIHDVLAPIVFIVIARHYFLPRGAREPLFTAAAFTAIVALMDLVVSAAIIQRSFVMFTSFVGTWLPFGLIFLVTLATGEIMSTRPWPKMEHRPVHGRA